MHLSVQDTIKALEAEGFSVKIRHERASIEDVERAKEFIRTSGQRAQLEFAPLPTTTKHLIQGEVSGFGGLTEAAIFRGGTKLVTGVALCTPLDPFEYYVGTAKALGRAIGELKKQT